jgi:hypothetical protein
MISMDRAEHKVQANISTHQFDDDVERKLGRKRIADTWYLYNLCKDLAELGMLRTFTFPPADPKTMKGGQSSLDKSIALITPLLESQRTKRWGDICKPSQPPRAADDPKMVLEAEALGWDGDEKLQRSCCPTAMTAVHPVLGVVRVGCDRSPMQKSHNGGCSPAHNFRLGVSKKVVHRILGGKHSELPDSKSEGHYFIDHITAPRGNVNSREFKTKFKGLGPEVWMPLCELPPDAAVLIADDGILDIEREEIRKNDCIDKSKQHHDKRHHTSNVFVTVTSNAFVLKSESCTQLYIHLLDLMKEDALPWFLDLPGVYDAACGARQFIINRRKKSPDAERLAAWAESNLTCDRLHFKNHKKAKEGEDKTFCQLHCDPDLNPRLEGVPTERQEETFQWVSRFCDWSCV